MKFATFVLLLCVAAVPALAAGGNQNKVDHDRTRVAHDLAQHPDPEPGEAAGQAKSLAKDQARLAADLAACPHCH